jgi:hypothetical protein
MRICEQGRGRKRDPKSGRSGNMKERVCSSSFSSTTSILEAAGICIDVFLMPLIPIVLRPSFLFLLLAFIGHVMKKHSIVPVYSSEEVLMASQEEEENECTRAVGMRTSEERLARWFPPVKLET